MVDLAANQLVRPSLQWPPLSAAAAAAAAASASSQQQQQPFFALQPNKVYAVQCLVERSRPRSQVTWFNRTTPMQLFELAERQQVAEGLETGVGALSAGALSAKYAQLLERQRNQSSEARQLAVSSTSYLEHTVDGTIR